MCLPLGATGDSADANVLIFCTPHQFITGIVRQLVGLVPQDAIAVSLTKVGPCQHALLVWGIGIVAAGGCAAHAALLNGCFPALMQV